MTFAGAAFAQESQGGGQQPQAADTQRGAATGQGESPADALVAMVGDEEICGSDVLTVISMLPEPLRA